MHWYSGLKHQQLQQLILGSTRIDFKSYVINIKILDDLGDSNQEGYPCK